MPLDAPRLLVRSPARLTPAWAEQVLAQHEEGVRVQDLELLSVDVGTTTRVRLRVEHDGPAGLPRRWFVKLPSGSWKARAITALPRLPQTEVRFYNELAGRVPVATPRPLLAAARLGRGYTLAIGDVTEGGGIPGASGSALAPEQALALVELLAGLHASHWEAPELDGPLAWLAGPVRRLEDRLGTALAVPLMRRGLERAGEVVPAGLRDQALRYARGRKAAMRFLGAGPRTLIHHDCHPGNLYWEDGRPGLLDWQLVRIGEGVSDVAYLLATCLEPEVRAAHEEPLLAGYAEALAGRGVQVDLERLRERYRAHLTYAFEAMVVTLAVGGLMDDAVALEMIRRAGRAVDEAGGFEVVARGARGA